MPDDQRTIDGLEDADISGGLDDDLGDDEIGGLDDDLGGLDDDVDVELGADPSAKYDDLIDGEPGSSASDDSGGFLSGLFGSDEGADETEGGSADSEGGFISSRISGGNVLSGRALLVAFLFAGALVGIASTFIPIVGTMLGVPLGLFLASFLAGLLTSTRRYAEFSITGTIIGVAAMLVDGPLIWFEGTGIPAAVGGVLLGLAVGLLPAVVGHYFGRDLRIGLTKDIGSGG